MTYTVHDVAVFSKIKKLSLKYWEADWARQEKRRSRLQGCAELLLKFRK